MKTLYYLISYLILIIVSIIFDQIINVKLNQRYGPKNAIVYLLNSLLSTFHFSFFLFLSISVVFVFHFYPNNNLFNLIVIIPLMLMFPIFNKKEYCKIPSRILLIVVFFLIYFSVIRTPYLTNNYFLYSPFTIILFSIGIISNILLANSNNYSLKIIRLTCLNFILINFFIHHSFYFQLVYLLIINLFQISLEKLFPKLNVLLSIKYYYNYLLVPVLFSFTLNYVWWYFFKNKSLLYFMGF